jgi:hypothetical protein
VVVPGRDHARFFILAHSKPEDGEPSGGSLTTDESGRFEIVRCRDVPHTIEVSASEQPMFPLAVVEDVLPGPDEVLIRVDPARMASARLKGRVLDARGEPRVDITVSPELEGSHSYLQFRARADGTFDLGPFPPGRYGIVVWKKRTPLVLLRVESVEVAPDEIHDFGDLIVD